MSYPNYTRAERWADGIVHVTGVTAALAGVATIFWMWYQHMPWSTFVATSVYAAGLILMLSASAAYHLGAHTAARPILRRIDHAAIYLLIAGTYTPFTLTIRDGWGWTLFGLVWGLSLSGVAFKLLSSHRFRELSVASYVLLGWLGVAALPALLEHLEPGGLVFLLLGGLAYTGGVVFYAWRRLPYHHAIWHLCVLAGSVLHFFAVLFYVVP